MCVHVWFFVRGEGVGREWNVEFVLQSDGMAGMK